MKYRKRRESPNDYQFLQLIKIILEDFQTSMYIQCRNIIG